MTKKRVKLTILHSKLVKALNQLANDNPKAYRNEPAIAAMIEIADKLLEYIHTEKDN